MKGGDVMLKKILSNRRGDFNLQYIGITAITVTALALVVTIGALIKTHWQTIIDGINSITFI